MFRSLLKVESWTLPLFYAVIYLFATLPVIDSIGTEDTPYSYFAGVDHDAYIAWYEAIQSKYTGNAFIARTETPITSNNATSSSLSSIATNLLTTGNNSSRNYGVEGVAVHWYVDELYVYIGVATRAQNGWVALGLAEAGGMKGSDIVLYETSKPNLLTDTHVLDVKAAPIPDVCQDWIFINSVNDNGFLIFEGKRLLNTMDGQDHPILDDTETFVEAQRIIAAWGNESDTIGYHGKTNRVRGAIRFYDIGDERTKFQSVTESADGSFVLFANNHTIENITTAYVDFCFNWDTDIAPQDIIPNRNIYAFAMEVLLDDEGASFIHHATLTSSFESKFNASRSCIVPSYYGVYLYGWTPGAFPLLLPLDVGIVMGPNDVAIRSFKLEFHYHNPNLLSGFRDSSGIKIYYKYASPTHLAGVMPLADTFNRLRGTSLERGTSRYDFTCNEECSTLVLGNEPVTVIGEYFHMHNRGASAVQYQIRNGEVIRKANVNFFDFDQTGVLGARQQSYQIFPGDVFRTSCIYQSNGSTVFGDASYDEMCNSFILYYPAKTILGEVGWTCVYDFILSTCNATLNSSLITADDIFQIPAATGDDGSSPIFTIDPTLERTFGYNNANQCNLPSGGNDNSNNTSQTTMSKLTGKLFVFTQCIIALFLLVVLV